MNATAHPDFSSFTLIAVNTEQNITNLLPVLQWGIRRVCLLSSAHAAAQRWADGLKSILHERGVVVNEHLFEPAEDSVVGLGAFVERLAIPSPSVWNLGGGLKSHQIALWRVVEKRPGDWAVYADTEGKTRLLEMTEGGLREHPPLATDASAATPPVRIDEVVRCFNRRIKPLASGAPARPITGDAIQAEVARFRSEQDYRRAWYARVKAAQVSVAMTQPIAPRDLLPILQTQGRPFFKKVVRDKLVRGLQSKPQQPIDQLRNSILNAVFHGPVWRDALAGSSRFAPLPNAFDPDLLWPAYFERLVQAVVAGHLAKAPSSPFMEALYNREVEAAGAVAQEHDVLLMTRSGVLHSLDAKTAGAEEKDLNSRILQFSQTSGRLARFTLVLPLFTCDLDLDECAVLREIPFNLARLKQPFVVVTEQDSSFFLARESPGALPRIVDKDHPGAVLCRPIEELLSQASRPSKPSRA